LGHNYKIIKWAFVTDPLCILLIFKACLHVGHHLRPWKVANIAVVPKPGKENYSLPKSYHPVALLKCMGKLLEKVVVKQIIFDINALDLIPTMQFGL
jgi:hypothetical protein